MRSEGDILPPSDWQELSLQTVAHVRFSGVDKHEDFGERTVRLCNYVDVYNNEYVTADKDYMVASASEAEIASFRIRRGDVIITKDSETPDDIGISAVVDCDEPDLICGYHLALLRPKDGMVDSTFLAKQLRHHRLAKYFGHLANGLTRYALPTTVVENAPLWLPNIGEQRAVAAVLRLVDEAIAKGEAVITKLQQVHAGLLHELLTSGLDEEGHLRDAIAHPEQFQDSLLGRIPKAWVVKKLSAVSTKIIDGTHRTPTYIEDGVPFLRVTDIQADEIDLENVKRIPISEHSLLTERCRPERGDLLYSKNGTVGIAKLITWDWEFSVFVSVALIKPDPSAIDGAFLRFVLESFLIQKQIYLRSKQMTVVNLHLEEIREFLIPTPSRTEQLMIAQRIVDSEEIVRSHIRELKVLRDLKTGLANDLLAGRVRVRESAASKAA
jgi:type I restriction enzyme S subunit